MGKEILVWERYPSMLRFIQTFLEKEGYGVLSASTKEEAVEILRQKKVDAIILDCYPRMNWEETARKLRSLPGTTEETPFLLMTTSHNPADRSKLRLLGSVLEKPFNIEDLLTEVRKMVGEPTS